MHPLLMKAAIKGWPKLCQFLIKKGCDPNTQTPSGMTAFLYASQFGHLSIIQLLRNKVTSLDHADQYGTNALMYAVNGGHRAIVQTLIEAGARIDLTNNLNETPLMCAVINGQNTLVELLCVAPPKIINARSSSGNTALIIAIIFDDAKSAKILIEANADITLTNFSGRTALEIAKDKNLSTIEKLLLNRYKELGIPVPQAKQPIVPADTDGTVHIQGATARSIQQPPAPDSSQRHPIAPPTQTTQQPAHVGKNNTPTVFSKLLTIGDNAVEKGDCLPESLVTKTKAVSASHIIRAFELGNTASRQKLLRLIKSGTIQCKILLLETIRGGNVTLAKLLIANGAEIDAQNDQGQTALMIAVEKANSYLDFLEIIELLKKANADRTLKDNKGRIYLDYASPEIRSLLGGYSTFIEEDLL